MLDAIYSFDYAVLEWIHANLVCPFLDYIMAIFSWAGEGGVLCIAIGIILICCKKTRKIGITVGFALMIGLIVTNITLKPLVARVRPYLNEEYANLHSVWTENLSTLIKINKDFSFPSGHTTCLFEFAMAIFLHKKKWGSACFAVAFLTAFSRLYFYRHYVSDVIVGMVIGLCAGTAAYFIVKFGEPLYWKLGIGKFFEKYIDPFLAKLFSRKKKEN